MIRTLALVCLAGALAVGCASSGTSTSGGSATSGGSEFGNEGGTDPGMASRSGTTSAGAAGEFRNVYFDYDDTVIEFLQALDIHLVRPCMVGGD